MSEEQKEEKQEEEKKLHAKPVSLISQIAAAVWIAGFGAFFLIKNITKIDAWDIVVLGFGIAGAFTPVYANLILEKFKGKND